MKKLIWIWIFILVASWDMCSQENNTIVIQQLEIRVTPDCFYMFDPVDTLHLTITHYHINKNREIKNKIVSTGNDFDIEFLSDNEWKKITIEQEREDNAKLLPFNIAKTFPIPLNRNCCFYCPGKYRIVKDIHVKDLYNNGSFKKNTYRVYAYFSVSL